MQCVIICEGKCFKILIKCVAVFFFMNQVFHVQLHLYFSRLENHAIFVIPLEISTALSFSTVTIAVRTWLLFITLFSNAYFYLDSVSAAVISGLKMIKNHFNIIISWIKSVVLKGFLWQPPEKIFNNFCQSSFTKRKIFNGIKIKLYFCIIYILDSNYINAK